MASAEDHAKSSASMYGGHWSQYFHIHNWFDVTREILTPHWSGVPDFRHRALRHHDHGIDIIESLIGDEITNSDGVTVSVRTISEQHMYEDFDCIPTFEMWWKDIANPNMLNDDGAQMTPLVTQIIAEPWMHSNARILV